MIESLEHALRVFKDAAASGGLRNALLHDVESAIQYWRAENPGERPAGGLIGRPKDIDRDVSLLRKLRAANPDSNCRREFEAAICLDEHGRQVSKPRAYIRYKAAVAALERKTF
jgi:hypothetical protein